MSNPLKLLFLCKGNSCRSQMAEGFCKFFKREEYDAYSAGMEARGLDPYAVIVMQEIGIDISSQLSKTVNELKLIDLTFDYVITVCSEEDEICPYYHAKLGYIHHPFDDPPKLAIHEKTEEDKLRHYRRVRDEIKSFIETLPSHLS